MKNLLLLLFISLPLLSISQVSFKKSVKEHRQKYKADFLKEEHSPFYNKKEELKYLRFFKPKKKYQVECTFTITPEAAPFDMATYSGQQKKYRKYGVLEFTLDDSTYQLAVYQSILLSQMDGFRDYLFLPFKDLTNGKSTYGGGRYINLSTGDIVDGKVLLDFNKNYNPYCAFSGGYNCPVPPKENHLNIAIKAGEKNFAKKAEEKGSDH